MQKKTESTATPLHCYTGSLFFLKMQALGNDFVIIAKEDLKHSLTLDQIRFLCDRRRGVGCDQLILTDSSHTADIKIAFYNADGSPALACGNGTRCVAKYLDKKEGTIETPSYFTQFWIKGEDVTISMPLPSTPQPMPQGYRVDVGNPHHVLFVDNLDTIDLEKLALSLQPPEGINVEVAQILSPTTIKVKVWERGVGRTQACGSGACAVGFLGLYLGLIKKDPLIIEMDGGSLKVEKRKDVLLLTGPADYCFKGTITLS